MKLSNLKLAILGTTWLVLVLAGLYGINLYSNSPGESGYPPEYWNSKSQIKHSSKLPTLLMFVHPKCPCTRASLEELSHIIARAKDKVESHIIFYRPKGFNKNWVDGEFLVSAKTIPKLDIIYDNNGLETKNFRVKTSGHVLLYDKDGRLIFNGGITRAREHYGGNETTEEIISFLNTGSTIMSMSLVFGCLLQNKKQRKYN